MKRILAIAKLTIKAAFRFRLVVLLGILLLVSVVLLPLMLKHDGSAQGFIQILLTYNLTVITALLGFSTLWLACGTLARDVEECQIQLVAVKSVHRWQILLGKWLGIMGLNGMLLGLSGIAVFILLHTRTDQLPAEERTTLRQEVLVARGSLTPPKPNIDSIVQKQFEAQMEKQGDKVDQPELFRQQIRNELERRLQLIPPHRMRSWTLNVSGVKKKLRDKPLFLRFKFQTADQQMMMSQSRTYPMIWEIGPPDRAHERIQKQLAPGTFHELQIPPNLFTEDGELHIRLQNHSHTAFLVPLEDGIEVLFREGGFASNYVRGLLIIYCWLALFAAIGLFAATFLSFPVAAFCAIAIMLLGLSSGTLKAVVESESVLGVGHHGTGQSASRVLDTFMVPVYTGLWKLVSLVREFSPIDSLSTGRMIGWGELARAISQIVILIGGIFSVAGAIIFHFRELALPEQ